MSKTTTLIKPKLAVQSKSDTALAFAVAGEAPKLTAAQVATAKRAFNAPEGYRRLTINLRNDLHKELRLLAIEQDCTATDIIERLLLKELQKVS